jgi:hypothetical protein
MLLMTIFTQFCEVFMNVMANGHEKKERVDYSGIYIEEIDGTWNVSIRGVNGRVLLAADRVNYVAASSTVEAIKHAVTPTEGEITVYELDSPGNP